MITRFTMRHFKRRQDATLDLDSAAVFIVPNNSGKTTALQALALWDNKNRKNPYQLDR